MSKSTTINETERAELVQHLPLAKILGVVVAASAFTVLTAGIISRLAPANAESGSSIVGASIDYTLSMTLGAADATSACTAATGGNVSIPVDVPNGNTYFACLNANVDTNSSWGYSLSIETDTAALIGDPVGQINATSGTIISPSQLGTNTWGFCIPDDRMTNVTNGFNSGLTTACGGANGNTSTALPYAAVPTTATLVRDVDTLPSTAALQNTPIRFGVRPTATLAAGTYTANVTLTASVNESPITYMQSFTSAMCNMLSVGDVVDLVDARDGKEYRVRKMPDNKCWMMDNLAYTGDGNNTFGDVVPSNSAGVGGLREVTVNTDWNNPSGANNSTRRWANNSNLAGTTTTCSPTTASGTGVMTSICGDQILYNWCAALGLDTGTTPTCAGVSNTTAAGAGTGMSSTGTVGATGGVGGESLGSGGTSICPTGWRIPRGRDNSSGTNDANNEWAILNGSFNAGAPAAANVTTGAGFMGYWQPAGTSVGTTGIQLGGGAFGTVSAGNVSTTGNLGSQSTSANWWTSSLNSATNAYRTYVNSTSVNPGTNGNNKAFGFSVRCVFP
ncbi:hypothetical protein FWH13_01830 [Candidatus Saccharibacteria bacterium]|nr:hypothetical protein [Candidatus Saccharibacteria bacterium]